MNWWCRGSLCIAASCHSFFFLSTFMVSLSPLSLVYALVTGHWAIWTPVQCSGHRRQTELWKPPSCHSRQIGRNYAASKSHFLRLQRGNLGNAQIACKNDTHTKCFSSNLQIAWDLIKEKDQNLCVKQCPYPMFLATQLFCKTVEEALQEGSDVSCLQTYLTQQSLTLFV